ncbi:MAG: lipoate--protein ligase [Clostridiales bacterium]|nr:lipoate--protein ligase [Clostridiales bacterium]
MIYLESPYTDPAFNLALEEYAFQRLDRQEEYFMLWRNDRSVVIGKHQNAREEVNLPYAKRHGIPVVRRLSGGGAVYHDPGNLNVTWIVNGKETEWSMERFARPILLACREFGIEAEIQGRNDLVVGGRKFSGNAGYRENGRIMHHGTVMIAVDKETMARVLRVDAGKIASNGVPSVQSRVVNLSECTDVPLTVETFAHVLRRKVLGTAKPDLRGWAAAELEEVRALAARRYGAWEWNYGSFPGYTLEQSYRVEGCGTVTVGMDVRAGVIEALSVRGDFLGDEPVETLEAALTGCRLERQELVEILDQLPVKRYLYGISPGVMADILCGVAPERISPDAQSMGNRRVEHVRKDGD